MKHAVKHHNSFYNRQTVNVLDHSKTCERKGLMLHVNSLETVSRCQLVRVGCE